jgi:DNA-binding NtrC family response regulator
LLAHATAARARRDASKAADQRLGYALRLGRALGALDDDGAGDVLLSVVDDADGLDRRDQARRATIELGAWLVRRGDVRLGRAHLERSLDEARRADDPQATSDAQRAALELALAWSQEGDGTRARSALALTSPEGPRARLVRGVLAAQSGQQPQALLLLEEVLAQAAPQAEGSLEAASLTYAAHHALAGLRGAPAGLDALDDAALREALQAVLDVCAAAPGQGVRTLAEVTRRLCGAEAVEVALPGDALRLPPDDPGPYERELRSGRLTLRMRGGRADRDLDVLGRALLTAAGPLARAGSESSSRVLQLLDRVLASDLEGKQLLDLASDLAVEATGAARGRIVLLPAGLDETLALSDDGEDFVSRSLLRHVVLSGQPLLLEDAAGAPPLGAGESVGARGLRSVLGAPLLGRRGQVLGVLYLDDPGTVGRFGAAELAVATGFAARLGPQVESQLRAQLRRKARRDANAESLVPGLVAASPAMAQAVTLLEKASASDTHLLISGEPGVGKEAFARALHAASTRAAGPFVVVSCGTLADTLLESELFGHRAGAFTGASHDRRGLFQEAQGGVLFLEGLDDASPRLQAELLRAAESGEVRPLGGEVERVDVRIVASFNGVPAEAMSAGRLREDLFYRLSVLHVLLPPLRERRGDMPLLVARVLSDLHAAERPLEAGLIETLEAYPWPGNLRELRACLERALLQAGDGTLRRRHLLLERPASPRPTVKLNARQLALLSSATANEVIRSGEYMTRFGVSAATAWRDLSDLAAKGLLARQGKGRGATYRVIPGAPS